MAEELAEDGGHAEISSEQGNGGLEQLCPGQAAMAAVGLGVATEFPGHPDPLGPCPQAPVLSPEASRPAQGSPLLWQLLPPAMAARVRLWNPLLSTSLSTHSPVAPHWARTEPSSLSYQPIFVKPLRTLPSLAFSLDRPLSTQSPVPRKTSTTQKVTSSKQAPHTLALFPMQDVTACQ